MNWHVYHFRGVLQQSFLTEDEAKEFIQKTKNPSEYYREYQEKTDEPNHQDQTHSSLK